MHVNGLGSAEVTQVEAVAAVDGVSVSVGVDRGGRGSSCARRLTGTLLHYGFGDTCPIFICRQLRQLCDSLNETSRQPKQSVSVQTNRHYVMTVSSTCAAGLTSRGDSRLYLKTASVDVCSEAKTGSGSERYNDRGKTLTQYVTRVGEHQE
ncbi:hypothetical protein F2P81_001756 [Scophthalmus maximus]|uniref:Uncharacterized protein n=1 Tax=Scophthalmus maximus TaxID=52904 RepID=A0A6A4TF27_SCOMX|nr:hypothetical protein F2P81_001756 [Scophthalmus maximus]